MRWWVFDTVVSQCVGVHVSSLAGYTQKPWWEAVENNVILYKKTSDRNGWTLKWEAAWEKKIKKKWYKGLNASAVWPVFQVQQLMGPSKLISIHDWACVFCVCVWGVVNFKSHHMDLWRLKRVVWGFYLLHNRLMEETSPTDSVKSIIKRYLNQKASNSACVFDSIKYFCPI